ncbi:multidrug efflux RND transporter permease subunit [Acetobacteraceae bacterium H6797]|nr:multidrug efflux RND transporter permease subunit [Acetobacteraceae bacterium H6797]
MNVSAPFIARPIATALLSIALLLTGLYGYWKLPVSALPEVDFPTIEVSTTLPGASPETMSLIVTAPLERQLAQIAGLTDVSSVSGPGTSRITLQFRLDRNIDNAAQDVQAAINAARGTLPSTLPYPPTYAKVNPADPPIITLALTSDTAPLTALSDAADTLLAQKLSQVSGVGRVLVQGNMRPALRLRVDPARLAAYGLTLAQVRTAITSNNSASPKGSLDGPRQASTVLANDQLTTPQDFADLVLAWNNGAPVRLRDVGEASRDLENNRNGAWYDGHPAVLLDVQRQPGANIVATVQGVRDQLSMLEASLPAGFKLAVVADRTGTIKASVHDVQFTLALSVALVVMVIFLFLRNVRATIIPGVSLPLSIIGTFGVMALFGFSLDNLSLMALTIATGFIVDDAIVMIENIVRLMEEGKKPLQAAYEGAKQIGFTIVSLTVSLIAVFIPLLFMSGVVGRLFQEFALTMTIAVVVSMVVSLTLTPMMCALMLREGEDRRANRMTAWFEHGFEAMRRGYGRSLGVVLRHQGLTLLVAAATLAGTIGLYVIVPKGFLPEQDTGFIQASIEGPQDVSFTRMAEITRLVAEAARRDPDVTAVTTVAGAGAVNPTQNIASMSLVLRPRDERVADARAIVERMQPVVDAVPGAMVRLRPVQDIQIGAKASTNQFQYTITESDPAVLAEWAPKLEQRLAELPQIRALTTDRRDAGLRVTVDVDRGRAGRLGVTMQVIDDALYDAFGQRQVSTIYAQNNQYRVVLEADPSLQLDPANVAQIRVMGSGTTPVPLGEVATIGRSRGPLTVTKQNQFPAVTIGFDLAHGYSLGHAVEAIRTAEREMGMPASIRGSFTGDAAEFQNSLSNSPWLILAAVIVIYITLGVLYESAVHPVTILSTLPSAGIGALLALWGAGLDLSVVGLIGIVLLMGIVKKNAIMMIDFAIEARRDHGLEPQAAITEACLLRFRPIMMTTMAALLGAVPLVVESGTGSELRFPLGVSVIGGLLLSQLLTLYTTPVVYLALERLSEKAKRRWRGRPAAPAQAGD